MTVNMELVDLIVGDIVAERERQERLKREGKFLHSCADLEMVDLARLAVLMEEVGEVASAVLEHEKLATGTDKDIRAELVQVAAVCVAWLEGLDKATMLKVLGERT